MREAFYMARNTCLLNYTKEYIKKPKDLLTSDSFSMFLDSFFNQMCEEYPEIYSWLKMDLSYDQLKEEVVKILKLLTVLELNEIDHPYLENIDYLKLVIELGYNFWREQQRYSYIYTKNDAGLQLVNFLEADEAFNKLILSFYRAIEEKVQGYPNNVYRQLQAGTDASFVLLEYNWNVPGEYSELADIPFVNKLMLRTPLIMHPKSNKRKNVFVPVEKNPMNEFKKGDDEWICFPCKVGTLMFHCYFHRDFTSGMVAMANLFQLATDEEVTNHKPDCIMLFGNKDGTTDTVYYHDEKNSIWVGKVSEHDLIEYFGYVKKMMLTLFNLASMEKGWLPIHGAMINLYLKDGSKKGIVLMGDSGAGKSETIEAMTGTAKGEIIRQEIIFDDMGSFHIDENGEVVAQGSEIGAFVRLDDLDKGTAYKDLDRSIFFNPESSNSRVVIPAATHETIIKNHHVDMYLYANNYEDKRGVRMVDTLEEAKPIFVEGKRFALGTTQEKGLSKTYFANPFGPMQEQELCNPIIDEMFEALFKNNIPIGEIYTCLGLPDKGNNGIIDSAVVLLDIIKEL
jgi:hypothetical protein